MPHIYTGTILLFTLFDLDLDDVVRVALWLKLSLPGGKNISGSMRFTYMTALELKLNVWCHPNQETTMTSKYKITNNFGICIH